MKEVKLTQGYVALVDDEDYARVSQYKWHAHILRKRDGSVLVVYARGYLPGNSRQRLYLHRVILGIKDSKIRVDHRDHNGLNCRRYNIRDSQGSNNKNTRIRLTNTSGFKGVSWSKDKEKWTVRLKVDGHYKFFGYFTDPLEAACAYDMAAVKYFGEFAHCNFAIPY
jgi:hypothetical protein